MKETASVRNVFSVRNFRLVFFGALVSEIGSVLYSFAVSFLILDLTGNNAFLQGLYLALGSIVLLLVTPVGGIVSDRYDKSRIMAVCDGLSGLVIVMATLGMYLFSDSNIQLVLLFAVGILTNLFAGFFSPASGSLLPLIVEEEQFQQANAYNSARSSLQSILG
ncbi:MAG: MFS transporter, partial [Erysipelotrichaceae bacterium]|nr:MFS transporter [Erysipelotrichaceae bacterium]